MSFLTKLLRIHRLQRRLDQVEVQLSARLAAIEHSIAQLQKMILLKEVAPEAFEKLTQGVVFDFSEKALCLPTNDFTRNPNYAPIKEAVLQEIVQLKLHELTPLKQRDGLAAQVTSLLELCSQVQQNRAGYYYTLLCTIREALIYFPEVGDLYFNSIRGGILKKHSSNNPEDDASRLIWLFYISFSLWRNDTATAQEELKRYVSAHGERGLDLYASVAQLAETEGYSSALIPRAALLFRKQQAAQQNGALEHALAGKSVALVGNGPCELGTGHGSRIDAHDVVIRFNIFAQFIYSLSADYGTKTSIWAHTFSSESIRPGICLPDVPLHVMRRNPYIQTLENLPAYQRYLEDARVTFTYVPDEIYREIFQRYGHFAPTTGFLLLYTTLKHCPNFSADHVFGYSFKKLDDNGLTHYNEAPVGRSGHDMPLEMQLLRQIFNIS